MAVEPATAGMNRARGAALLGVASVALLGAAIRWAHHWGVVADTIVAAWAAATMLALVVSIRARPRLLARLGLALAGVSLLALVLAGLLYAAGVDTAGACGGG